MDLLGPLPESPQKSCYVIVVGDYFSQWMKAIPLPNQEVSTIADHLVDEVFMQFSAFYMVRKTCKTQRERQKEQYDKRGILVLLVTVKPKSS